MEFQAGLVHLGDRGLVGWDRVTGCLDLHPIIRGVIWRGVDNEVKLGIYSVLEAYFKKVLETSGVKESEIKTLTDLEPAIERFHALVGLRRYDEAYEVFQQFLDSPLYYRLAAGRLRYEILLNLLPATHGETKRVRHSIDHALILFALAKGAMYVGQVEDAIEHFQEASASSVGATRE